MIPEGLGYVWGQCLLHEQTHTCFLPVPKCASTSTRRALLHAGFVSVREAWEKPPGWWTFAVSRNPEERLASGIRQVARQHGLDPADYPTGFPKDVHLIDQAEFLHPANPVDRFVPLDAITAEVPRLLAERGVMGVLVSRANTRRDL